MTETHSKIFFSNTDVFPVRDEYKPILITDHFSTPENIGHVIRLAANIGALKVLVVSGNSLRLSKIKKTAGAAFNHLPVEFILHEELENHLPDDYILTALETASGAESIFSEQLPDKMALVLGSEKYGISKEVLAMCSRIVFIPMTGSIQSMNVSHAAAVCVFHWLFQHSNKKR